MSFITAEQNARDAADNCGHALDKWRGMSRRQRLAPVYGLWNAMLSLIVALAIVFLLGLAVFVAVRADLFNATSGGNW